MMRRFALVGSCLLLVLAGGLALRADVRHYLWWTLTQRTGAPEVTWVPQDFAAEPDVRFAVAGDVGTGGDAERATAAAMDALEAPTEYDALLLLGDNVYPNGDPARLGEAVFEPFAGVLDNGTELLAVLGNHDVQDGNAEAHAEAIGMPGRWYATEFDDVLVVALDSTRPDDPEQLRWLEETLTSSSATWKVATMHHPPYSAGYHGSSEDVRDAFSPVFARHGVQLVLAGHDHDYQRNSPEDGITYVVSGGAAKLRSAGRADFTNVAWSTHHFLDVAVWGETLQVRAVNQQGRVFDSFTLHAPAGSAAAPVS